MAVNVDPPRFWPVRHPSPRMAQDYRPADEVMPCRCCGRPIVAGRRPRSGEWLMTQDHIIARRDGGTDDRCNIRFTCQPCNSALTSFGQCLAALRFAIMTTDQWRYLKRWRGSPLLPEHLRNLARPPEKSP